MYAVTWEGAVVVVVKVVMVVMVAASLDVQQAEAQSATSLDGCTTAIATNLLVVSCQKGAHPARARKHPGSVLVWPGLA